jgi:hypothetical protein
MHRYPLANREEELDLFDRMVAGETRRRILLLQAAGGLGKTTLLAEFVRRCPDGVACVPVDLKGGPGLHEVLARLCDVLGWEQFPRFAASARRLARDAAGRVADVARFEHVVLDHYPVAAIHDLMKAAFTVQDLRRFCRYRPPFGAILPHFGEDSGLEDAIEVVVQYCQTRALLSELLVGIREARFGHYQRYYTRLYGGEPAEAISTPPGEGPTIGRAEVEGALRSPDEADRATRRAALTRAFFHDLGTRPGRLVLIFDTCEQAGPEVEAWLAGPCLAGVQRTAGLVAVVAGRQVPEESVEWTACCLHRRLPELRDSGMWQRYADLIGAVLPNPEWIAGFCDVFDGHPLKMMEALARYVPSGGRR